MARWNSCNVLQLRPDQGQLWQFDATSADFKLNREQSVPAGERLPSGIVGKTWSSLWQRKLNIAWLPPESLFLRVIQLPASSPAETQAMVELQLEKLSPVPVAQIVWSIHRLSQSAGELQTIVVAIAERKAVEEFLGQLEGQGFMADRLEIPAIDLLQTTQVHDEGAWIFPEGCGGKHTALTAWWYGGVLCNLTMLNLPDDDGGTAVLKAQLGQTTWAGELEGWLTSPPTWHLVASPAVAAEWEPLLREAVGDRIEISEPPAAANFAALTARRATQSEYKAGLMPPEFATRYQQQFVDRLWMRALVVSLGLYMAVVAIYFSALWVVNYQTTGVQKQIRSLSTVHTNYLQSIARLEVLRDRQELKYAVLDCWNKTAELMPDTLQLDSLAFKDGRRLTLNGSAPSDKVADLYDFHDKLRKSLVNGKPLFDPKKGDPVPPYSTRGGTITWSFALELNRSEDATR